LETLQDFLHENRHIFKKSVYLTFAYSRANPGRPFWINGAPGTTSAQATKALSRIACGLAFAKKERDLEPIRQRLHPDQTCLS
jgi:hypothetical protein